MSMGIGNGDVARDTISGFKGIVVAEHRYLNGCVRLTIQPQELHEGKPVDDYTFDIEQLELVAKAKPQEVKPTGGPRKTPSRRAVPKR